MFSVVAEIPAGYPHYVPVLIEEALRPGRAYADAGLMLNNVRSAPDGGLIVAVDVEADEREAGLERARGWIAQALMHAAVPGISIDFGATLTVERAREERAQAGR